jgi:acetyl-CoA acyltransferase
MIEAVIVSFGRSAIGKAPKGSLRYTRPESIASQVMSSVLKKVPQLKMEDISDVIVGCAFPEAEQGMNIGRLIALRAGLPKEVAGQTVNRFCSSGLQSIATAANAIMAGQAEVILAGGVESMSLIPMGGNNYLPDPLLMETYPQAYMSMGITAEKVAAQYKITREQQDEFAVASNIKAAEAQKSGKFKDEIIPIEGIRPVKDSQGRVAYEKFIFDEDEGIRANSSMESVGKLKPAFRINGTVTAGNSSQMSDGAAFVLLMSKEKAKALGLEPIAIFKSFAVGGVDPSVMGLGPIVAIPKALKLAGVNKDDIEIIELNEAFASQSIACIQELGFNKEIVNVNGGAIALGHPLGCTGTFLTIKTLCELRRRKKKYGLVSMCIGGGMGAAAVFEMC